MNQLTLTRCLGAITMGFGLLMGTGTSEEKTQFPCAEKEIPHYTAYRLKESLRVDGVLKESGWRSAPRSPRFVDLISGAPALYDTRTAVLWDDNHLYVGYWVEEPNVTATLTQRDSFIYKNNDVELFIAGKDAYYEFEVNAFNTIYEVFFIWEQAYEKGGFASVPEFSRSNAKLRPFNGVGFKTHPRGPRLGSWVWDFPGLQTAVHVDGTLNNGGDKDRGWTVELALPWRGMKWLAQADNRSLPPKNGVMSGAWIFHASISTRLRRQPKTQAAGPGAGTAFGTRISPSVSPTFTSQLRTLTRSCSAADDSGQRVEWRRRFDSIRR